MKSLQFEENASFRLPRQLQQQRVNRVIREELTEKQRQVLMAYYFQNMTIPQIAAQRGIHKSAVCRLLQRAERRLRQYLRY